MMKPQRKLKKKGSRGLRSIINPRVGIEVIDPRIVKSHNSNSVQIYFTPTVKSSFTFALYRSGDSEREPSSFRIKGDKTWQAQVLIKEVKRIERIKLDLELHPEEVDFVHEVVIQVAK